MSLSQLVAEDALRLAVLLAGELHAVRIDDGALTLHALTPRGEARVVLHPDTRAERYLMRVRETLAGHATGSPGGYPVHLRRWTRSGHASPKKLEALLCLGEPEAVTAVSLSENLTDELARRAWWACPDADIARSMLGHAAVRRGAMGPVLAQHLLEHLPFEADADAAIASVRAVAAAGLLDSAARERLWRAAQTRPHYLIGWLLHEPQTIPAEPARAVAPAVAAAAAAGDPAAALLVHCASAQGQAFLRALTMVIDKLPTHEATYQAIDLVTTSFAPALQASSLPPPAAGAAALPAARALAAADRAEAEAILRRTSAVGPLMRRHLKPVLEPMQQHLMVLRGLA